MAIKILLADDSLTIQKVVELTFSDAETRLVAVGSGDRAVQALDDLDPDIVLADVVMPGLTGYDVCEAVKKRPGGEHVPVVLLTGTFEPFDRDRAERVGSNAIVTKPFDSHALQSLVRELVGKARVARAEAEEAAAAAPAPVPEPPPTLILSAAELEDAFPPPAPRAPDTASTLVIPRLDLSEPPPPFADVVPAAPEGESIYSTMAMKIPTSDELLESARSEGLLRQEPPVFAEREPEPPAPAPVEPVPAPAAEPPASPFELGAFEPEPVVEPPPLPPAAFLAEEPAAVPPPPPVFLEMEPETAPPPPPPFFAPEPVVPPPPPPPFFEPETESAVPPPPPAFFAAEPALAPPPPPPPAFFEPEPEAVAPPPPPAFYEPEPVTPPPPPPFYEPESVTPPPPPAFFDVEPEQAPPPPPVFEPEPAVLSPLRAGLLDGPDTEPVRALAHEATETLGSFAVPLAGEEEPAAAPAAETPFEMDLGPEPAPASGEIGSEPVVEPPSEPAAAPEEPAFEIAAAPPAAAVVEEVVEPFPEMDQPVPAEDDAAPWDEGPVAEAPPPPPALAGGEAPGDGVEPITRDLEADLEAFEASGRVRRRPEIWERHAALIGEEAPPDIDLTGVAPVPPAAAAPASRHDGDLEEIAAAARLEDLSKLIPAAPAEAATTTPLGLAPRALSDADVDRIARRVVELLADKVVRDIAWEVVPDYAERLVRERIAEVERAR